MAELTNLTDRIAHLRHRKAPTTAPRPQKPPRARRGAASTRERPFATDYFVLFVYALLSVALLSQVLLILWLDLL